MEPPMKANASSSPAPFPSIPGFKSKKWGATLLLFICGSSALGAFLWRRSKIEKQRFFQQANLMTLLQMGDTRQVKQFLDFKKGSDLLEKEGGQALIHASVAGQTQIMKLLLE